MRVIWVLLAAAIALLGAEAKRFVVGFAQDTMTNDWRVAQVRELEAAFKNDKNIEFVYTDGKGNLALSVQNIEELIARPVDVLIASPLDAKAMTPVIESAYKKGIPVVLLSRRIEGDGFTTFIHPENRDIAKQAARYIAKELKGKGKIFILQHVPTTTPAIHRTEAFFEEIKKYPGLEVTGMKVANSLRADAIKMTEEALREGLKFDAVYAQSDSMAVGAIMALKAAGVDPKPLVITGIDYISEVRAAIVAGELDASFTYPTAAAEGAEAVRRILRGQKVPKEQVIDSTMVTRENVRKIEPIF